MALGLKQLIRNDISGGSLWVTDQTGEYASPDNETGWGDPNEELNESALAWSIVRNTNAGKVKISPVSIDVQHDAGWTNAIELTLEFLYGLDGWHTITFFRLPVSANDIDILGGGTLIDLQYYYDSGNFEIRQLDASDPLGYVIITDYEVMRDDNTIVQLTCEEIYYNKLAIKANDFYKEYQAVRDQRGGEAKEAQRALNSLLDIREDIRGADYAFRSGNTTKGQGIVETALARYNIV